MITLLTGENNFELTRTLEQITATFDGEVERIDGSELETRQLPDLLMGGTLFSSKRLVIIRTLSENKSVWNDIVDWLPRVSNDVHVVLVEPKPDKRTKTYKELIKIAKLHDFPQWTDRDASKAERWVVDEATRKNFVLDNKSAQTLVSRIGVDQWQLFHALEKLSVLDAVTPEAVIAATDARPSENVFNLLDAALRGNRARVKEMLTTLQLTDDPYMVFGLLSSQVFQLATLAVANKPAAEVAKDIGAHPFALQKLTPYAERMSRADVKKIVTAFARADTAMKSTSANPWIYVERALAEVM